MDAVFPRKDDLLLGKINCTFAVHRIRPRVLFKKLTRDLCATLRRSRECHNPFMVFPSLSHRIARARARFLHGQDDENRRERIYRVAAKILEKIKKIRLLSACTYTREKITSIISEVKFSLRPIICLRCHRRSKH